MYRGRPPENRNGVGVKAFTSRDGVEVLFLKLVLPLPLPYQGHGAQQGRPARFDKNLDDSCQSLDQIRTLAATPEGQGLAEKG